MEDLLTALLLENGAFVAQVGDRVHWMLQPGGEFPSASLQVVSSIPNQTLEGASGFEVARVQVSIWAETYGDMLATFRALRNLVDGHSGTSGAGIQGVLMDGHRDLNGATAGNERDLFGRSVDLMISWAAP